MLLETLLQPARPFSAAAEHLLSSVFIITLSLSVRVPYWSVVFVVRAGSLVARGAHRQTDARARTQVAVRIEPHSFEFAQSEQTRDQTERGLTCRGALNHCQPHGLKSCRSVSRGNETLLASGVADGLCGIAPPPKKNKPSRV